MKTSILTLAPLVAALAVGFAAAPALASNCGSSATHAKHDTADHAPHIFELAEQAGFTTLVAAIQAAGLDATLNGDGPFTVFAPTDEAFARLPEGTLESLLKDKDALTRVLLYHVTSGAVSAEDVADLRAAKTLNGEKVAIETADGVMINDARVIEADVQAGNGVIHVIDTVLMPTM